MFSGGIVISGEGTAKYSKIAINIHSFGTLDQGNVRAHISHNTNASHSQTLVITNGDCL